MDSVFLPYNLSNSSEDELNAYLSDLLSQQSSASFASAPYTNYRGNEFGGLTSVETSFGSNICDDLPTDITWDDYLLLTEGLLEGTPSFDTPAAIAPSVSNINASGDPSTLNLAAGNTGISVSDAPPKFNPDAGSAPVNLPIGLPTFFGAESAAIDMPIGLPTWNPAAGSTNVNMPVGLQMFDLSAEITGTDMPVGSQTTIEHPSYLGCGNGGFPNGTNAGDSTVHGVCVGINQQVHQPINGVHVPLALPNTSLKMSSNTSSETESPLKRANEPSARHTTPQRRRCERAPSPVVLPISHSNSSSNTSSETQSPPKRSRPSSPSARPPAKRPRFSRAESTIHFVHDERSMPANFRANPDNHGRFQYTASGSRKYLNGPSAVQE